MMKTIRLSGAAWIAQGLIAAGMFGGLGDVASAAPATPWQVEIRSLTARGSNEATSFLHPLDEIEISVKTAVPTTKMRIVVSDGCGDSYH